MLNKMKVLKCFLNIVTQSALWIGVIDVISISDIHHGPIDVKS